MECDLIISLRNVAPIKQIKNLKHNNMTLVKFKSTNGIPNFPGASHCLPSFFNEKFDRFWTDETNTWMPLVNIKERANDFKIDLAVAGMDKKDFKIEIDNDLLIISGERKEQGNEENEKLSRREFHYGSFKRSFSLPESANTESIAANYNNGILTISVAKKEDTKQKTKKEITVA
jgi:HSP20 family protein